MPITPTIRTAKPTEGPFSFFGFEDLVAASHGRCAAEVD
jgi:hypothetical protein